MLFVSKKLQNHITIECKLPQAINDMKLVIQYMVKNFIQMKMKMK